MGPYKEGDSIRGFCKSCRKSVNSTLMYRSYPIENGLGLIENALLAVCNECDTVIAIPAQSESAVRAALDKINGEIKDVIEFENQHGTKQSNTPNGVNSEKYEPASLQLQKLKAGNLKILAG